MLKTFSKVKTWYKVHKWLSVFVGVFLIAWLISGILMILPDRWFVDVPENKSVPIDYSTLTVSPAVAVEVATNSIENSPDIWQVNLKVILDTPVYQIIMNDGSWKYVDAQVGEIFKMTPSIAEQIVRVQFGLDEVIALDADRMTAHDISYPFGPLPVYKVAVSAKPDTYYIVQEDGSRIFKSTWLTRARTVVTSLHDFSTLNLILNQDRVRKALLLVISMLAIATAIIGYCLALPRRQRR
jgi:hypothetical protein